MQEQKFVKVFRIGKIIQLCILIGIELTFFLILTYNPNLSRHIFSSKPLFTLCAVTWIVMIFSLVCLLFDFYKLRSFAAESHALNKAAYLDHLTGMPNRHSLDIVFQNYSTPESVKNVGCALLTIVNLKNVNEEYGHDTGDRIIQDFCNIFEEVGDTYGFVGRNGGNEFVAILSDATHESMNAFLQAIASRVKLYNDDTKNAKIEINSAYVLNREENKEAFMDLLTLTYTKLQGI